jgi:hypothetical protein
MGASPADKTLSRGPSNSRTKLRSLVSPTFRAMHIGCHMEVEGRTGATDVCRRHRFGFAFHQNRTHGDRRTSAPLAAQVSQGSGLWSMCYSSTYLLGINCRPIRACTRILSTIDLFTLVGGRTECSLLPLKRATSRHHDLCCADEARLGFLRIDASHDLREQSPRISANCLCDSQQFQNIDAALALFVVRNKRLWLPEATCDFRLVKLAPLACCGKNHPYCILALNPHRTIPQRRLRANQLNRKTGYRKNRFSYYYLGSVRGGISYAIPLDERAMNATFKESSVR